MYVVLLCEAKPMRYLMINIIGRLVKSQTFLERFTRSTIGVFSPCGASAPSLSPSRPCNRRDEHSDSVHGPRDGSPASVEGVARHVENVSDSAIWIDWID